VSHCLGVLKGAEGGILVEQIRRTYIYYSDDKILDLRRQIPPSRWESVKQRLSGVEVTVLGSGGKISMVPPGEDTIFSSLQRVWVDLDEQGWIGSFDEPNKFVYGQLVFYYGIFSMFNPPLFVLAGATDQTIVVLGGSQEHVRSQRGRKIRVAADAVPVVMEPEVATELYASEAALAGMPTESLTAGPDEDPRAGYSAKLYRDWNWRGNKMEYEVLARIELRSSDPWPPSVESPKNVLVGSPLFVAQV
jgi:hypothetical protein